MANVQQGGRVALITGASRGIGAGAVRLLASRDCGSSPITAAAALICHLKLWDRAGLTRRSTHSAYKATQRTRHRLVHERTAP
jgi:NAD(P)-dependent dehydrogenase (short-subunit alcohol dehydrogenase family)